MPGWGPWWSRRSEEGQGPRVLRHFLTLADLGPAQLRHLLSLAADLKRERLPRRDLAGKTVALLFEKPSLRTRVSFEVAVAELGGTSIFLGPAETQLGAREPLEDAARVLGRYVHALVVRTFGQERLETLAALSGVPVVNALSDREHPCQALADLLTLEERFGHLRGLVLAYVGDGNNVAHALLLAGALAGMEVRVATPPGYQPLPEVVERARALAASTGGKVLVTTSPTEAVEGADAVYTDVWASMGREAEAASRLPLFRPYQVNLDLLGLASPRAVFMHCLPAHRGEEVAGEVMESPRSVVFDQAENRLHTAKAVLLALMGEGRG
jgi:ornithine carbamoyltransferase